MGVNFCEDTLSIPISALKRIGFLVPGLRSGTLRWGRESQTQNTIGISSTINEGGLSSLRFVYTNTAWNGEKADFDYIVRLTTTACHLGGTRYWFVCPFVKNGVLCNRRAGVLYSMQGYFVCRHCAELGYEKQYRKHTGEIGWAFKKLDKAWKVEADWEKIRYKYWKGEPTKRFAKVLRKAKDMGMVGIWRDYRKIKKL